MSGETRSSSRDVLENGLRSFSSFLRSRGAPGKARLNRQEEAPIDPACTPSASRSGRGGLAPRVSGAPGEERASRSPRPSALAEQQHVQRRSPPPLQPQQQQQHRPPDAGGGNASCAGPLEPGGTPALELRGPGEPSTSNGGGGGDGSAGVRSSSSHRVRKFHRLLSEPLVDLDALRELSWSGVPGELRPLVWRLLLGYLPPNKGRQASVLGRKRREYADMVPEYYEIANSERSEDELGALRQVSVDVPRTAPGVPIFHEPRLQKSLERMLYIWGIRHPASGYVQGMNDLVTPFFTVFLSEHLSGAPAGWPDSLAELPEAALLEVEADSYWCLSKLLDGIQDHFTYAQPGIQRAVFRLKELLRKASSKLVQHLDAESIDFLQFAFRWINCLLIREVPMPAAIRLWDTYLAEGSGFSDFLVYACAALLQTWEPLLPELEFQELMLFLQKLPTAGWGEADMELVLSRAYVLRDTWGSAHSHLRG